MKENEITAREQLLAGTDIHEEKKNKQDG